MATITDVAKHAGVSKSTVSKVLNEYPNLSEKTIERVKRAIEELEYVPNQTASSLSKKNFKKIGVILKQDRHTIANADRYMQYLLGIDLAAVTANIEVATIFTKTLEGKTTNEIITYLKSKSITCLIIIGLNKDDEHLLTLIDQQIFPTVVTEVGFTNERTSCVGIDNYKAQYKIANDNIERYRASRVLYVSGPGSEYVADQRMQAIKKIASRDKQTIDYCCGDFNEEQSYRLIDERIKNYDLIICASDAMAVGVNRALKKMNLKIPILGFNGTNLLAYIDELIPSVKVNFFEIARLSVLEVLSLHAGKKSKNIKIGYKIGYITSISQDV